MKNSNNSSKEQLFHQIKGELLAIYEQIRKMRKVTSVNDLRKKLSLLDNLAHLEVPVCLKQNIVNDPELQPCLQGILQIHRKLGVQVELEICETILAGPDPWEAIENFHYFNNYQFLAKMEGITANLLPHDRVVFLGSGPFPLTLILLHRLFHIKGIGIEIDPGRADLSRRVLEKLSLDKDIQIITGCEDALVLIKGSKLIMVAAFAEPRKRIFQRLAEVIGPDTLVSYRIYEKGMRDIFSGQPLDESDLGGFVEVKRIPPQGNVNNTIIFLKKAGK